MKRAEQAVADLQASRAQSLDDKIRQAAYYCIKNAEAINEILVAGTIGKTTHRVMDESRVRGAIEQAASALAQQRIQVNVSTQNRLNAHIEHLNHQVTEMREKYLQLQQENISLQQALEVDQERTRKVLLAKLSKAQIEEELELLDSFEINVLDQQMFPTPKKPAPEPRDGTVVGGGNLFGTGEELQHKKLKY